MTADNDASVKLHPAVTCDHCGEPVGEDKTWRYGRNPNHDCARDGHFCSTGCYDVATGAGAYR